MRIVVKNELIQQIRRIAEAIRPFASSHTIGQTAWDGKGYAPVVVARSMDPTALAWCSSLSATATMMEYQDCPLSEKQLEYLRRNTLGGMGSLNDWRLDEKEFGGDAKATNEVLDKLTHELYNMIGDREG